MKNFLAPCGMNCKALECYERETQNPDYLTFDDAMIKAFARRIVGQIKEQMKLDNEQCELLMKVIFKMKKISPVTSDNTKL